MAQHIRKRKCKHCKVFFAPDHRNVGRQHYCSQPSCRQASKAASQRQWLRKPVNRDYFSGPAHVERVRQWRQAHPRYWRRQAPPTLQSSEALQEPLGPQALMNQQVAQHSEREALQDAFFIQPTVLVGLIAHLTGLSLQDDIALTARRLQQLGRDILHGAPPNTGGRQDAQTP
ncbi:MAG TPA: hypothetical protein VLQ80_05475, partial [Candidatus Saccharimonadia bacterium]|nr:hypothetical protein [Candidatus Saccharimonadia bacterium]